MLLCQQKDYKSVNCVKVMRLHFVFPPLISSFLQDKPNQVNENMEIPSFSSFPPLVLHNGENEEKKI